METVSIFFQICDLDFVNYFLLAGIYDYFGKQNLEKTGVFMKCVLKNIESSCADEKAGTQVRRPSRVTKRFQIIFIVQLLEPLWF